MLVVILCFFWFCFVMHKPFRIALEEKWKILWDIYLEISKVLDLLFYNNLSDRLVSLTFAFNFFSTPKCLLKRKKKEEKIQEMLMWMRWIAKIWNQPVIVFTLCIYKFLGLSSYICCMNHMTENSLSVWYVVSRN